VELCTSLPLSNRYALIRCKAQSRWYVTNGPLKVMKLIDLEFLALLNKPSKQYEDDELGA
jgi:hypothetical protein